MRFSRFSVLGAAAVASAALLLGGCGQGTGNGEAPAANQGADALTKINDASKKMQELSYAFSMKIKDPNSKSDVTVEGVMHRQTDSMQFKLAGLSDGEEGGLQLIKIGKDAWMKLDMDLGLTEEEKNDPAMKGMIDAFSKWNHLPADKMGEADGVNMAANIDGMSTELLEGAADFKETEPGTFTGTIDITKKADLDLADAATLDKLGEAAKAVPVTVKLDSEGRMSSMSMEIPGATGVEPISIEMTFTDFDKVEAPKKPAAKDVNTK